MARSHEKAKSNLNRWVAAQSASQSLSKRPHLASLCTDLTQALKWRNQILSEIRTLVSDINAPSLSAQVQNEAEIEKIRELNDAINKRLREKKHWEKQIRVLGGPDHTSTAAQGDLDCLMGSSGYMYFGAAKNLPSVRELFEQRSMNEASKQSRQELLQRANAFYYGVTKQPTAMEEEEGEQEQRQRQEAIQQWYQQHQAEYQSNNQTNNQALSEAELSEIERLVVEKKKRELLSKYIKT